jgi:hypothetical protein
MSATSISFGLLIVLFNIYRWAGTLIAELCEVRLDEPANKAESQLGSTEAIRLDQLTDDLHHPRPVTAAGDHVGALLERRYGVGNGH